MSDDKGFLEGYSGEAELTIIPTGEKLKVKPPPLSDAARFIRLLQRAEGTAAEGGRPATPPDPAAMVELIEEFPKALGIEAALLSRPLFPAEFLLTVAGFFWVARTPVNGQPASSPEPETTTGPNPVLSPDSSDSGLTTS
jgi:hypothetical protein